MDLKLAQSKLERTSCDLSENKEIYESYESDKYIFVSINYQSKLI